MTITRTPGQSPLLPGAVTANGFVFTSGLVSPTALAGHPATLELQVEETVALLLSTLAAAGTSPDRVVKLDAFLVDAAHFGRWNEEFLTVWPEPGPARTTLVLGFANPAILFELHVIAAL